MIIGRFVTLVKIAPTYSPMTPINASWIEATKTFRLDRCLFPFWKSYQFTSFMIQVHKRHQKANDRHDKPEHRCNPKRFFDTCVRPVTAKSKYLLKL